MKSGTASRETGRFDEFGDGKASITTVLDVAGITNL
jgi:hypothetical protein